jgi:hypothetical protein
MFTRHAIQKRKAVNAEIQAFEELLNMFKGAGPSGQGWANYTNSLK